MTLQTDITVDQLLNAINWNPEKDYKPLLEANNFPNEQAVAAFSPAGHGKTTTISGMAMRANFKVGDTLHSNRQFKCRTLEKGSTIHDDVSKLSMGYFPGKTQTFLGFRSSPALLVEEYATTSLWGLLGKPTNLFHKARQINICDLPGETLSAVQWQYRLKTGSEQKRYGDMIGNAIMEMRNCQSFMPILSCAKAQGFGEPIEKEIDPNVNPDPDVSQVRQLEDIATHKSDHGQRIREVYVILASWDKLEVKAKELGFDMYDPNLVKRQRVLEGFVRTAFFQFFAQLHSCGIPENHIHYYPTYFQTVKDKEGREVLFEDEIEYYKPDGTLGLMKVRRPHIMTRDINDSHSKDPFANVRRISYSEQSFDQLLDDIMKTAPTVQSL
jgi:hypothetical protein